MPGAFDPNIIAGDDFYSADYGLDPRQLRAQQWGAMLTAMGAGLLRGRNWNEGLGIGFGNATQAAQEARRNAFAESSDRMRVKRYLEETRDTQQMRESAGKLPAPRAFDPEVWKIMPPEKKFDIYRQMWEQQGKPTDAPPVKDFYEGGMVVQKQWDPQSRQWTKVGSGPRWQPQQSGADAAAWETVDLPGVGKVQRNTRTGKYEAFPNSGGATPSQQASNAEIDAARAYLIKSSFSMADIVARTQETTSTGRDNPDFDPYLTKAFNLAMSRKVGDDPDFEAFQRRYRTSEGAPEGLVAGGAGTRDNPLIPKSQADIDNAPSGTVIQGADGALYVKP